MSRRHGLIGASKPYLYKEEDAEFYYRQTSGGVIMNNSPLVGSIDRIKGQTIAWNQPLENGDFSNGIIGWNCGSSILSVFNNVLSITVSAEMPSYTSITKSFPTQTHKYYYRCNIKHPYTTNINIGIYGDTKNVPVTANTWVGVCGISNITTEQTTKRFNLQPNLMSVLQVDDVVQLSNVSVYDLTLIYGEGNEPSTPEDFEADYQRWFGKPLTYEPYDKGSLRNVQIEGIKSVGFNQWDEEWEQGYYGETGTKGPSTTQIRSKKMFGVIGGAQYYFNNRHLYRALWYNSNKQFISVSNGVSGNIVTAPDNAKYLNFSTSTGYGGSYNNDICINISDTNKNGTYKPYKSETRNFDVTALTGKLNGEGESIVIFPDGMKGVNDVKDEIYVEDGVTKAVKRIGRVDLGSLSWSYNSVSTNNPFGRFSSISISSLVKRPPYGKHGNILCFKYVVDVRTIDKSITLMPYTSYGNVSISDSSYTDAATFTTAMSGVYLDYELAEPQVYVLDTPLPLAYNCEANGTEQILPEVIGTGIAPIMDIKYKVGNVAEKPWYGIKWSEDNGQMQRIASNMELHATLPIQSKMKRCVLLDNGSVYKYISDADPFLYEDSTSVKYDGTDGQVMVEVPAYWYTAYKETDENNITWNYLKLYPEGGGQMYSRKIYRGAFEMITDNSDNSIAKGCSVSMLDFTSMGTTKDTTSFVASDMQYLSAATSYRNWNYANVDATDVKNSLGKPTTNRDRATFRGIAARRGAGFSQEYWDSYNSLIRLYVVEYCNFKIQANINNSLTVEGFKQGGLGAGVTNANFTKWSNFNSNNSSVPCGVTVPLGNKSGAVSYAFTNDDFDDVSITYSVPSYRGIENPFGHINKFIDGFNKKGKVENDVTTEMIYVCDTVSKFAENDADGYVLQSDTAPRANGNFGGVDWDAKGTFWPKLGGRTMYSDYFYNSYDNNTWYTLPGGGSAYYGSYAGLFCLHANYGSGYTVAAVGSRLLYTK